MILDKKEASVLTRMDWATLPDTKSAISKREVDEETGLELVFMRNPQSAGSDSMVMITHSVAALRDGDMIFAASLEALDLRSLSSALGESVKNLQMEYGVRGFLSPERIVLYGNGEKEDLGVYLGERRDDEIFDFLRSLFEDSFISGSEDDSYSDWIVE